MSELRPCAFCGSTNMTIIPESDSQCQAIYCDDCPGGVEDNNLPMDILMNVWNSRPIEKELLEALEELLRADELPTTDETLDRQITAMQTARQAINRARGKQP